MANSDPNHNEIHKISESNTESKNDTNNILETGIEKRARIVTVKYRSNVLLNNWQLVVKFSGSVHLICNSNGYVLNSSDGIIWTITQTQPESQIAISAIFYMIYDVSKHCTAVSATFNGEDMAIENYETITELISRSKSKPQPN